jgi:hypothetical protein
MLDASLDEGAGSDRELLQSAQCEESVISALSLSIP